MLQLDARALRIWTVVLGAIILVPCFSLPNPSQTGEGQPEILRARVLAQQMDPPELVVDAIRRVLAAIRAS